MSNHFENEDIVSRANRAVRAALGADRPVACSEEWGGGAHNRGFRLTLDSGERLFWKVEKEGIFPRTRRGQVEREVAGIRLAAQAGVDCPRILGYDAVGQIAGCRYLLEEFVEGDLLGEAMRSLGEAEQDALLAEFQARAGRLSRIQGEQFGEVDPGGPLGQHAAWPGMMAAFSTMLLEDAATLGCYTPQEMALVRRAHAAALAHFRYSGPPAFSHLDLHVFNAFAVRRGETVEVGKLFDFGFCLYLAPYVARYNERAFGGEEARIAREYGVEESELHAFHLVFALEFVNFIAAIRWAPEQPYGYVSRLKEYLEQCAGFLNLSFRETGP